MTIVAGFKGAGGVLLCADTQETIGGISKRQVPKLLFFPQCGSDNPKPSLAACFCGATDDGPFLDEMVTDTWASVQEAVTFADACLRSKEAIREHYRVFEGIYGQNCPHVELVYGIKAEGNSALFSASRASVNEVHSFATGGIGCHLANFIIDRMGHDARMNLRQCLIIAAYMLYQTKQYVDGCGGDSHIAVLQNSQASGEVSWNMTKRIERDAKEADDIFARLIVPSVDLAIEDDSLRQQIKFDLDALFCSREYGREEMESLRKWWMCDDLGVFLDPKQ